MIKEHINSYNYVIHELRNIRNGFTYLLHDLENEGLDPNSEEGRKNISNGLTSIAKFDVVLNYLDEQRSVLIKIQTSNQG